MKKHIQPIVFGASIALCITALTTSASALIDHDDNVPTHDLTVSNSTEHQIKRDDMFKDAAYITGSVKELYVKTAVDKKPVNLVSDGTRVALKGESLVYPNRYETKEEGDYVFAVDTIDNLAFFSTQEDMETTYLDDRTMYGVKVKAYHLDTHGYGYEGTIYKDKAGKVRGYTSDSGQIDIFITDYNE